MNAIEWNYNGKESEISSAIGTLLGFIDHCNWVLWFEHGEWKRCKNERLTSGKKKGAAKHLFKVREREK